MSDAELGYLLSPADAQRIFYDEIVPDQLAHGVAQRRPVAVFVVGQPGAGTARTAATIKEELDRTRGGAIHIDPDLYQAYHPESSQLLLDNDWATAATSGDRRRWTAMAEAHLVDERVDIVIETKAINPANVAAHAAWLRQNGYRVEAAIIAVPEPLSRLGIVHQVHTEHQQFGQHRFTPRAVHDASYQGVADLAQAIDQFREFDVATVYRPGNQQLGVNYLDGAGNWRWPETSIAQLVDAERHRTWTPDQLTAFTETVGYLAAELGSEWHDELRDIASRALPLADAAPPAPRLSAAALAFPHTARAALASSHTAPITGVHRPALQPASQHHRDAEIR